MKEGADWLKQLDNLTASCMPCNRSKSNKTEAEFLAWRAKS